MRHIASIITATMEAVAPPLAGNNTLPGNHGGPQSLQANIRLRPAQGGGGASQHIFYKAYGENSFGVASRYWTNIKKLLRKKCKYMCMIVYCMYLICLIIRMQLYNATDQGKFRAVF